MNEQERIAYVEELWQTSDVNGDGVLDKNDVRQIFKEVLEEELKSAGVEEGSVDQAMKDAQ